MRRGNDGLAIIDIFLELGEKIGPSSLKALQSVGASPIENSNVVLEDFERPLNLPLVVPLVIMVRRDMLP